MDALLCSPHVLAIPLPIYGHVTPILSLCKILVSAGACSVTFLNTQLCQEHLDKVFPSHHPLRHPHGRIRCITIPDSSRFDLYGNGTDAIELSKNFFRSCEKLRGIVEPLVEQIHSTGPPFVCVLSDTYLGWTQDVADKLGVPRVAFSVTVAAECQVYYQAIKLISTGVLPFKAPVNGASPIRIPGLPPLARTDFPAFLQIENSSDIRFRHFLDQAKRLPEASVVLFNSFIELENSALACMKADFKSSTVGPLFMLEEKMAVPKPAQISSHADECITWLDKRTPNSVIYVAFGTLFHLSPARIAALAEGLEASHQAFLWALLPNPISGEAGPFPDGFLDRIRDRGLVVSWAPQIAVLGHPSVGGFLTHCGWNAVMEGITLGVPMLVCPLWTDHMLIAKLLVDEWKIAMSLKDADVEFMNSQDAEFVKSEDVEKLTTELMEGGKGRELRKRAGEYSVAAKRAVESGGSSQATLQALIEDLRKRAAALDP